MLEGGKRKERFNTEGTEVGGRGHREEKPKSTGRNHPAKSAGWGGGGCATGIGEDGER